jgi:hypothetical protein
VSAGSGSNSRAPLRDVKRCNKSGSFEKSTRGPKEHMRFVLLPLLILWRRCRGNRARCPLSVSTMHAVGGAVTGAVTAMTRGRDPCAGRDRLHACRDRRGRSLPAESPGQRPGPPPLAAPEPLAHETLACATEVVIALGGTSSHVRLSRPLLPRLRPCHYARRVSCAAVASRARCARRDPP